MSRLSEMVFICNQQTQRWMDVTGEDVACWSDKRQYIESSAQHGFWATLGQLLLAGFCCLLLAGCGATELPSPELQARAAELSALLTSSKTVETKSDEILKVVESNTTALAAIQANIEALQVKSETPKGQEVIQSSEPPATANNTPKSSQVATPAASSSRIASDGTVLRWNIEGNWNPTILQTSAHLREHGIDTDGMTHQEMADLHASIHDGKPVAMKSETVRYVSRGTNCPNGQCPTSSTRYVSRRRR
jgi:hypothetical protein